MKTSIKLFFAISALMVIAISAQGQDFVSDGLIAMWTMDKASIEGDVLKDVSGNGNDANIMGAVNFDAGIIGEAAIFDGGAGNYIEVPDMGEMEQDSVECWAYEQDWAPNMQGILSTWDWTGGKVHFKFQDNQIQVDKNGVGKVFAAAEAQTWYHIIYTQGINEGVKLYVDGEFKSELASTGAALENWHERRIGSEHDGRFLNGMIDEVRVYDRILTEEEIMQNFENKSNSLAVKPAEKLAVTWGSVKE